LFEIIFIGLSLQSPAGYNTDFVSSFIGYGSGSGTFYCNYCNRKLDLPGNKRIVYLLQHILLPKAANSKASKQVFETPGLKLKLKWAFKALQQKGIKITDYKEDVG
jgi:hypothetical protein